MYRIHRTWCSEPQWTLSESPVPGHITHSAHGRSRAEIHFLAAGASSAARRPRSGSGSAASEWKTKHCDYLSRDYTAAPRSGPGVPASSCARIIYPSRYINITYSVSRIATPRLPSKDLIYMQEGKCTAAGDCCFCRCQRGLF